MSTALDLIKGALRKINSYSPGETLAPPDANDALEVLNDMLDSWSTDHAFVYASPENVFQFVANQYQYSIGPGGDFAVDSLTGEPVQRPLRITSGFTRFSGLDFELEVTLTEERYASILLKNQPAPWPLVLWYNPVYPLGLLNFYPAPSAAGELHLYTDQILTRFTSLNQVVSLPQGYSRAIKWALARELCSEYGYPLTPAIEGLAKEAVMLIRSLNQTPVPVSKLDEVLSRGNRTDASWILTGGFR